MTMYENVHVGKECLAQQVMAADLILSTTPEVTLRRWKDHLKSEIGPELTYIMARCFEGESFNSYCWPPNVRSVVDSAAASIDFSRANEATHKLIGVIVADPNAYAYLTGRVAPTFSVLMEEFWMFRGKRVMPLNMPAIILRDDLVIGRSIHLGMMVGDGWLHWGPEPLADASKENNLGKVVKVTFGIKVGEKDRPLYRLHFQIIKPQLVGH